MGYVGNEKRDEELKAALNETAVARALPQNTQKSSENACRIHVQNASWPWCEWRGISKRLRISRSMRWKSNELAAKQRAELYYQAKSSNALAARALMESLGAGSEPCKAKAKMRKVQVVKQAKALRLIVKPHLTAAIQSHQPLSRSV